MQFDFNRKFEEMMEIHDLDTVMILGHMNPDGDSAGCVMGLAHYIKVNYPQYKVLPYLAETLDKGPKKQVKEDRVFDPFRAPEAERYGVIVCDTATRKRMIGLEYFEAAAASIVIDHHASNEGYGDVNYIEISESCAENVFGILNPKYLKRASMEEHPTALDYIYMGILHDTDCFARADAAAMQSASYLLSMGVDHRYVMRTMQTLTLADLDKRSQILNMAERALDGKVAFVCITRETSMKKNIGYEDIHPISGILRDCEDVELGFTMYEEEAGVWRCSFRSDGKWMNVNKLLTPFGGGGHAAAAGLTIKSDDPEKLKQDFIERIKQGKEGPGKFLKEYLPSEDLNERFEFRNIKPEETDQAIAIEQICFPPNEACSLKNMRERVAAAPELFLVAVDKETKKIAGFLNGLSTKEYSFRDEFFTNAGLHDQSGRNIMLLGLDVLPKYRRQGLATELMYRYLCREREKNRCLLILTCLQSKVKMYEKMGFTDCGEAESDWGGEKWHEMTCMLNM